MKSEKLTVFKNSLFYSFETIKTSFEVAKKEMILLISMESVTIPIPLVQAYLAKLIMDQVSLSIKGESVNVSLVVFYLFLEFLTVILPSLIDSFKEVSSNSLDMKTSLFYKERFFNKLKEIDLAKLENPKFQDDIQEIRYGGGVSARDLLSNLFSVARGVFVLVSFFGLLFTHNVFIAILLVIASAISFYLNFVSTKQRVLYYKNSRLGTRVMWHIENLLIRAESAKEIKALDVYDEMTKKHQDLKVKELEDRNKMDKDNEKKSLMSTGISKVLYYLSYGWIIFETLKGRLSLGDMTMVLMLYSQSQGGLTNVFGSLVRFYESHEKLKTLFDFWKIPASRTQEASPEEMQAVQNNFSVEFKGVSFSYPGSSRKIFDDLSLKIESGTKLAIVGENGAGKSTLIKLLLGLYEPTEGVIILGGVDLRKFSRAQLKEILGVVFQDFMCLHGVSVQGNVVIGNLKATQEEYEQAKYNSGTDEMIQLLGVSDDALLGKNFAEEGLELSGGQWQKLALARAFVQPGKILVLDEPTSAIDAKMEYEIFEKVQELTKGKTTVLVSHRFSTVRSANSIVFLDQGKIIEQGTHEELLAKDGQYAKMFNLQARGYR